MSASKYSRTMFYALFFFIMGSASTALGQDGTIAEVSDDGNMGYLIVSIRGEGALWVCCTVYPSGYGNREVDLEPVKAKGDSQARFNVFSRMNVADERLDYVVSLWKDKTTISECENKHGKGSKRCQQARRHGFQMEGLLDQKRGIYTPGFD
ncbi:MAG: hypothetical protein SWE60_25325 [Thermodesulfobacteriota bacterium]|nr:hypothetical protein [Thermodesulfobacteriota bacterium]